MKKYLFIALGIILLFCIFFAWQSLRFADRGLHIVFCDVGQGDAILMITPSGKHILLDGGVDDAVLSCLSRHMPFWDRDIELMVLSHPHADHLNGLISVLERYKVDHFATEPLENKTSGYKELLNKIQDLGFRPEDDQPLAEKIQYLLEGDSIQIEKQVVIEVLGPSKEFLASTSPNGTIGESSEFASLIMRLSYGTFDVLFTGDSQVSGIQQALRLQGDTLEPQVDVLQVPHHGSKYGLDKDVMEKIDPKVAVISVGKNNYGHPAPSIVTLLQNEGVKYFRTDQDGDIEIVSDGKSFWLK